MPWWIHFYLCKVCGHDWLSVKPTEDERDDPESIVWDLNECSQCGSQHVIEFSSEQEWVEARNK